MSSTFTETLGPLAFSVKPFVTDHAMAGAVLMTGSSTGTPSFETIGCASIAAQVPMRPDTLFWIASNSKQITAAALMLLVEEGKVGLDAPVSDYLPEFKGQMFTAEEDDVHKLLRLPARPATVRDLVSHTSGISPWSGDGRLNTGTLRERALACALTPLRFEPGTKWEYGNGGFEVAGRIIEVVSGETLELFMQTRLFEPLGMSETTFWPSEAQVQRLATPYAPSPDASGLAEAALPFTSPLSEMSGSPSPGGGLFSTAHDLFAFGRLIAGGGVFEGRRLLSEASVRTMTTTQTGTLLSGPDNESGLESENGYGLGWNTTSRDRGKPWPEGIGLVHHSGAHGTNLWIDPQQDRINVFMIAQAGWPEGFDSGQILRAFWDAAGQARGGGPS